MINGNERRRVPSRKRAVPALGEILSRSTRRKAAMWYLEKLPVEESNKPLLNKIKDTLEKAHISARGKGPGRSPGQVPNAKEIRQGKKQKSTQGLLSTRKCPY